MGGEIGFGEIENNCDGEINYDKGEIEFSNREIKINDEICV